MADARRQAFCVELFSFTYTRPSAPVLRSADDSIQTSGWAALPTGIQCYATRATVFFIWTLPTTLPEHVEGEGVTASR